MPDLWLVTPSITPFLATCALDAVARTTSGIGLQTLVMKGPKNHGQKLDLALKILPTSTEWLFTMDDDAAPLCAGWLEWLIARKGNAPAAAFWQTPNERAHPLGALYSVPWLRAQGASFQRAGTYDVGEQIGKPGEAVIAPKAAEVPWWLDDGDAASDDNGRLLWGHLGGGTIGANNRRLSTASWPILVNDYLRVQGL